MTSTIQIKPSILARDSRFKSSATISPSPNAYRCASFADLNKSTERGSSFSKTPKLLARKGSAYPGPGSHTISYNPEKKLAYTMRSRVNHPDNKPVKKMRFRKLGLDTTIWTAIRHPANLFRSVRNIVIQRRW